MHLVGLIYLNNNELVRKFRRNVLPPIAGRQMVAGSYLKLSRPEDVDRTFLPNVYCSLFQYLQRYEMIVVFFGV
jgi:hypothetical protein